MNGLNFGYFIIGAEAAGAEVETNHLSTEHETGGMDVGSPIAVGVPLGMADVMTEHGSFPTKIALQFRTPLNREKDYCNELPIHSNIMRTEWQ